MSTPHTKSTRYDKAHLAGLNPAQQEAVAFDGPEGLRVVAGAGTGKTHLIARRFIGLMQHLKQDGVMWPEEHLMAITFTVKAAREMAQRIQKLCFTLGYPIPGNEAYISNYHGLCNRLLRRHATLIGLSPRFTILTPLEKNRLLSWMTEGILQNRFAHIEDALAHSNLAQILSPTLFEANQLLQAPLASIRFTALFQELANGILLDQMKSSGFSPLSFYQTATQQREYLTQHLNTLLEKPLPLETPEDQCRAYQQALAPWMDEGVSLIPTPEEWQQWELTGSKESDCRKYCRDEKLAWLTEKAKWQGVRLLPHYHLTKGFVAGSHDTTGLLLADADEARLIELVTGFYALYQWLLHRQGLCDFDDLINRTLDLLERNPHLARRYQEQFKAIIVDEFQDSNRAQLRLIQKLQHPGNTQLTVVGDLKQSIYGFRHAQPENLDLIFEKTPPKEVALQTNYRSSQPILAAANHLAETITHDPRQQLTASEKMATRDAAPITWIELGIPLAKENAKGEISIKDPPIGPMRENEARWIAVEIARLIGEGTRQPSEIAVLVPDHQKAETIENALRQFHIPAIRAKNLRFFREPAVLDVMACLKLLNNPYDEASLVRLLSGKLNHRQLKRLCAFRKEQDLNLFAALQALRQTDLLPEADTPELPFEVRRAVTTLAEIIQHHRAQLNRRPLLPILTSLIGAVGLVSPHSSPDEQTTRRQAITTFKKLLYPLVSNTTLPPTLQEVVDTLNRYSANPKETDIPAMATDATENAVQILTVSASKGLEFKTVFVAYTFDASATGKSNQRILFDPQYGNKPGFGLMVKTLEGDPTLKALIHKTLWQAPRNQAEKLRLFYVALTRAEEQLFVIRGRTSPPWTAAESFPSRVISKAMVVRTEADDPEWFRTHYWQADTEQLTQAVLAKLHQPAARVAATPEPAEFTTPDLRQNTEVSVSFSSIQTVQHCPVKYSLRYQWRLPEPCEPEAEGRAQIARAGGSCVHALIEQHYQYNGQLPEAVIQRTLDTYLPEAGNSESLEAQRKRILALFNSFTHSRFSAVALASQHLIPRSEQAVRFPMKQGTLFNGTVDLLLEDERNGTFSIIDFKTDRDMKPERLNLYFEQLYLYRKGVLTLWPQRQVPVENLMLVHLTENGVCEYPFQHKETDPSEGFLKGEIMAAVETIVHLHQRRDLPQRPAATSCHSPRCPYLGVCPKAE